MEKNLPFVLKEAQKVKNLCATLLERVVDGKSGIKEEDYEWLTENRTDYKIILSLLRKQKSFEPISKKRVEELEEKGLFLTHITEDDAFVTFELLDALKATFDFIKSTDPASSRDNQKQGFEHAQIATSANIEFADFFLKVGERFDLGDAELVALFEDIFHSSGLHGEFRIRGLAHFPGGILALVRTYSYLKKTKPNWKFRVPTVDLDMNHGVDLIVTSPNLNETQYIDIKGRISADSIWIKEITQEEQLDEVRRAISRDNTNPSDVGAKLRSIYKIYEFVRNKRQQTPNSVAFYAEVPSA